MVHHYLKSKKPTPKMAKSITTTTTTTIVKIHKTTLKIKHYHQTHIDGEIDKRGEKRERKKKERTEREREVKKIKKK